MLELLYIENYNDHEKLQTTLYTQLPDMIDSTRRDGRRSCTELLVEKLCKDALQTVYSLRTDAAWSCVCRLADLIGREMFIRKVPEKLRARVEVLIG